MSHGGQAETGAREAGCCPLPHQAAERGLAGWDWQGGSRHSDVDAAAKDVKDHGAAGCSQESTRKGGWASQQPPSPTAEGSLPW